MTDDPPERIPGFDRVSIRAVVVGEGEDPNQALRAAGIIDPIAVPVVFGENAPDAGFGDGITANLTAVLELDQEQEQGEDRDAHSQVSEPSSSQSAPQSPSATNILPPAFGLQPLAPIAGSGSRSANGGSAANRPPSPTLPAKSR